MVRELKDVAHVIQVRELEVIRDKILEERRKAMARTLRGTVSPRRRRKATEDADEELVREELLDAAADAAKETAAATAASEESQRLSAERSSVLRRIDLRSRARAGALKS